jgi:hypothetical protein
VKIKLTVVAQDVLKFNGSLLELRSVMLTGVSGDDICRIAVVRHFGKFKPSSNVPFEADIYVPVQERIIVVRNDVFELLNHTRHKRVITPISALRRPRGLAPGRDQNAVLAGRGCSKCDVMLRPACWADPVRDNELTP